MTDKTIYHLIPADFSNYNINDLLTEKRASKEEGNYGIPWKNGSINGYRAQNFQVNDIVYVYFHNLTGQKSHILLRGIVSKIDNNYIDSDDGNKYSVFYLGSIKYYIKPIFTYERLLENKIKMTQTKQYLGVYKDYLYYKKNNNINHGYRNKTIEEYYESLKLIDDLEAAEKSGNLIRLKEQYNKPCEICKDNNHTFIKENGLYYYEEHHLLEQNILRKKVVPNWYKRFQINDIEGNSSGLVYTTFNTINLCPVCHRKLHYGLKKDRKEILEKLLTAKRISEYQEKVGINNIEEVLNYIYAQYSVKRNIKKKITN